jgi:hypothetical protein
MGNEKPITLSVEQWFSPELGVVLASSGHTSTGVDTTYTLEQIVRTEPDPSLFTVPADYTRQDGPVMFMGKTATATFTATSAASQSSAGSQ